MKNILKGLLAIALMATLSSYANAQSLTRLCFQTGTKTTSCQPVTAANPLPSTATLSITSLNVSGPFNVTVTNTATVPVIVSTANGFGGGGSASGPFNVTITNNASTPVIVSAPNGLGSSGPNSVTITNTAAVPVIVSNPNGLGGSGGPSNVTITNTVAVPAIVTCTNCGAATVNGPFNVTVTNTANVSEVNSASILSAIQGAIPAGTNTIGQITCLNCTGAGGPYNVTLTNTLSVPAVVSCTNCGASSISSVTILNQTMASAIAVTGTDIHTIATTTGPTTWGGGTLTAANTSGAIAVTCSNCGAATVNGPFNVTITNTPAVTLAATNVTVTNTVTVGAHSVTISNTPAVTNTLATTGGWTPLLVGNLLTTVNAIKTSAGQLGKLFCYNPNATVAYIQVWNLTSGNITVGSTTPTNSYGIPATTSAGFAMSTTGDSYSVGISVAATTLRANGTPPTTGLDCNASYN